MLAQGAGSGGGSKYKPPGGSVYKTPVFSGVKKTTPVKKVYTPPKKTYTPPRQPIIKVPAYTRREAEAEKLAIKNPRIAPKPVSYVPPKAAPSKYYPKKPAPKPAPKPAVKSTYKPPAPKPAPRPVVAAKKPVVAAKPVSKPVVAPKPVVTPANPVVAQPSQNDYLKQVNAIYDQQKKQRLAEIQAQRDKAINDINLQKTQTSQGFQQSRNAADVVNNQQTNKLRELMAAQGLTNSGDNISAQVALSNERQNSLNTLNTQEKAQLGQFDNRIADLKNPQNEQAIISAIEADRAKAQLDAQYRQQDQAWRQYTYNNMSAAQKAQLEWAKQQYGEDAAWRMYQMQYQGNLQSAQSQAELDFYKNNANFSGNTGGGGTTGGGSASFQSDMNNAIKRGVPAAWAPIMTEIAKRESSWNPKALNKSSGTYGYGQFQEYNVDSYNKKYGLDYRNNPVDQLIAMYHYIQDRYHTPQNALAFWNKNHWY